MPTDGVKKKTLLNILHGQGATSVRAGRGLTARSVHPRESRDPPMVTQPGHDRGRNRIWERGGTERAWNCEPQGPHL